MPEHLLVTWLGNSDRDATPDDPGPLIRALRHGTGNADEPEYTRLWILDDGDQEGRADSRAQRYREALLPQELRRDPLNHPLLQDPDRIQLLDIPLSSADAAANWQLIYDKLMDTFEKTDLIARVRARWRVYFMISSGTVAMNTVLALLAPQYGARLVEVPGPRFGQCEITIEDSAFYPRYARGLAHLRARYWQSLRSHAPRILIAWIDERDRKRKGDLTTEMLELGPTARVAAYSEHHCREIWLLDDAVKRGMDGGEMGTAEYRQWLQGYLLREQGRNVPIEVLDIPVHCPHAGCRDMCERLLDALAPKMVDRDDVVFTISFSSGTKLNGLVWSLFLQEPSVASRAQVGIELATSRPPRRGVSGPGQVERLVLPLVDPRPYPADPIVNEALNVYARPWREEDTRTWNGKWHDVHGHNDRRFPQVLGQWLSTGVDPESSKALTVWRGHEENHGWGKPWGDWNGGPSDPRPGYPLTGGVLQAVLDTLGLPHEGIEVEEWYRLPATPALPFLLALRLFYRAANKDEPRPLEWTRETKGNALAYSLRIPCAFDPDVLRNAADRGRIGETRSKFEALARARIDLPAGEPEEWRGLFTSGIDLHLGIEFHDYAIELRWRSDFC